MKISKISKVTVYAIRPCSTRTLYKWIYCSLYYNKYQLKIKQKNKTSNTNNNQTPFAFYLEFKLNWWLTAFLGGELQGISCAQIYLDHRVNVFIYKSLVIFYKFNLIFKNIWRSYMKAERNLNCFLKIPLVEYSIYQTVWLTREVNG